MPFIAPLLAEAKALASTLTGTETQLQLPALPVIVKTPAMPLVVCPPKAREEGSWDLDSDSQGAIAIFRSPDGVPLGFALTGSKTEQQRELAQQMPDLLPPETGGVTGSSEPGDVTGNRYECDTCGYIYVPAEGDPEGGIAPGTPWEEIPDDWICPVCGAGKEAFSRM